MLLFERQGKTLRIFEGDELEKLLSLFVEEFRRGRILTGNMCHWQYKVMDKVPG